MRTIRSLIVSVVSLGLLLAIGVALVGSSSLEAESIAPSSVLAECKACENAEMGGNNVHQFDSGGEEHGKCEGCHTKWMNGKCNPIHVSCTPEVQNRLPLHDAMEDAIQRRDHTALRGYLAEFATWAKLSGPAIQIRSMCVPGRVIAYLPLPEDLMSEVAAN